MKWTIYTITQEALKYKTRSEFSKNSSGAYKAARKQNILDRVCGHMILEGPLNWPIEKFKQIAAKYNSRTEFQLAEGYCYQTAHRRGFFDAICVHMEEKQHRWTEEELQAEALKYKTRSEFSKNSPRAYSAAIDHGILQKIQSHMPLSVPAPPSKWTKETLEIEAKKYQTKMDFRTGNPRAYKAAKRKTILNDICAHMPPKQTQIKAAKVWTLAKLQEEALKHKSRHKFKSASRAAFNRAKRTNVLDYICSHMEPYVLVVKWTLEKLQEEALKYETKGQFKRGSPAAFKFARKRKLLNIVCKHMKKGGDTSLAERTLFARIKERFPSTVILQERTHRIPDKPHIKGFDVDIYVPELRKGIEFDGTYWHTPRGLAKSRKNWPAEDIQNYHQIKDDYFFSMGIRILHVKEEAWETDSEECISRCLEFLSST